MSSMVALSRRFALLLTLPLAVPAAAQSVSVPVVQQLPRSYQPGAEEQTAPAPPPSISTRGEGSEWDAARARLRASGPTAMAGAVSRWQQLSASDRFGFSEYAGFLLSYPGFPEETKLRRYAEKSLVTYGGQPSQVAAFFDRFPPLSSQAGAQYAVALSALQRQDAPNKALLAWRAGPAGTNEAALGALVSGRAMAVDHDARMDALLWAGAADEAARQIAWTSPQSRDLFMARLAVLQGSDPAAQGLALPAVASSEPGYLYTRARQLMRSGQGAYAASLLANRGRLSQLPLDPEKWVDLQLSAARAADAGTAVRLASMIDDAFAPGADISRSSFDLRDDYTSLMWLAGTKALWSLGDGRAAAPLFWRYGAAARTPQTRSKGFYWAGRALARAGDSAGAARYFEAAGAYADQFYGQLALERLGRAIPTLATKGATPTAAERAAFAAKPITAAVREVARDTEWPVAVRFFKEIAEQAQTPGEHQLVADLARELGRRDLGVIMGQAAGSDGIADFQHVAFPLIPTPDGTDWTMVHAITRQESQFAANAVSHAGARGLMQLMPGTAREQAGKVGLSYDSSSLMLDPGYNIRLGDGYFQRMLSYYGGSYPLAVAAYNAGAGNVNKWLRANGDPRSGSIDWIDWLEKIPVSETRNYVQRVLENAVDYEAMYPQYARSGPRPLSRMIGKSTPG